MVDLTMRVRSESKYESECYPTGSTGNRKAKGLELSIARIESSREKRAEQV